MKVRDTWVLRMENEKQQENTGTLWAKRSMCELLVLGVCSSVVLGSLWLLLCGRL